MKYILNKLDYIVQINGIILCHVMQRKIWITKYWEKVMEIIDQKTKINIQFLHFELLKKSAFI